MISDHDLEVVEVFFIQKQSSLQIS
jgi:hypothetical protein